MNVKLGSYGFSKEVQDIIQPILEIIDCQNLGEFSRQVARLALKMVSEIGGKKGTF